MNSYPDNSLTFLLRVKFTLTYENDFCMPHLNAPEHSLTFNAVNLFVSEEIYEKTFK